MSETFFLIKDSGTVFSYEFCEISNNRFFTEPLRMATSVNGLCLRGIQVSFFPY